MEQIERGVLLKTPVSLLQELLVKRGITPYYKLLHEETGHNPLFIYEVTCLEKTAVGEGKSKREAKHAAAESMLKMLSVDTGRDVEQATRNPYAEGFKGNATGALKEFCSKHSLQQPVYTVISDEGSAHSKIFTISCCIKDVTVEGKAYTKKEAKHVASYVMLKKMKELLEDSNLPVRDESDLESNISRAIEVLCSSFRDIEIPRNESRVMPVFNFEDAFKKEPFISSETLKEIRGKRNEYFDQMRDPVSCFKKLMHETKLAFDVSRVPVQPDVRDIIFSIQIRSFGNATFWGKGLNEDSALKDAALNGLKWFAIMSV